MKFKTNSVFKKAALIAGMWLWAMTAHAFSINCARANTKVEHLICDTVELRQLDYMMAARYAEAMDNQPNTGGLQEQQQQWLKKRNACSNVDCIKRAYFNNTFLLQARPRYGNCVDVYANDKRRCGFYNGKGYSVCEAYLKHLNSLKETPYCQIPQPPGFTSPQWQELDVLQHLDWAYQMDIQHRAPAEWTPPTFENWRKEFLEMLKAGKISPQIKKARIKPLGDEEIEVLAYTGDRLACQRILSKEQEGGKWSAGGHVYRQLPSKADQPLRDFGSKNQDELLLFAGSPYLIHSYESASSPSFNIDRMFDDRRWSNEWPYSSKALCGIDLYEPLWLPKPKR